MDNVILPIREYTFTVAANGSQPVDITSDFLFIRSLTGGSSSELTVKIPDFGVSVPMQALQKLRLPQSFDRFVLENTTASAMTVVLLAGAGDFDDNDPGTVTIADFELQKTVDGTAYAVGDDVAAVAAQYAVTQLANPASSGYYIDVYTAWCQPVGAACVLKFGQYDNQAFLTTVGEPPENKLHDSGAASIAYKRAETNASTGGNSFIETNLPADAQKEFINLQPHRLEEGQGLVMWSATVNVAINFQWEWCEVAI